MVVLGGGGGGAAEGGLEGFEVGDDLGDQGAVDVDQVAVARTPLQAAQPLVSSSRNPIRTASAMASLRLDTPSLR